MRKALELTSEITFTSVLLGVSGKVRIQKSPSRKYSNAQKYM